MFLRLFIATIFVTADCLFLFFDDHQCNINIYDNSSRNVSLNVAETVPALCHNGTFHWILQNGSAKLTFLKTWFARSVCITNSIFEVQDVTHGELLYANGNQTCTRHTWGNLTLRIDSPEQREFAGIFHYTVNMLIII